MIGGATVVSSLVLRVGICYTLLGGCHLRENHTGDHERWIADAEGLKLFTWTERAAAEPQQPR